MQTGKADEQAYNKFGKQQYTFEKNHPIKAAINDYGLNDYGLQCEHETKTHFMKTRRIDRKMEKKI